MLIVDNFFVSHEDQEHFQHLHNMLHKHYQITVDNNATKFCGMDLEWNYDKGFVKVSMAGYIKTVLQRFMHPIPA